ncbi:class F sortase [Planomonospora sp. ID82291]|uniref:class F sortase n=1 Tax=Planomonospora sp. ID82291 TaxID=2738136 RepID=UPI0018C387FB|nr:class F sortase [Planomonospora sp. ID82291]MBG0812630.1 class F sortase [Planomonospora sp. ID82291]
MPAWAVVLGILLAAVSCRERGLREAGPGPAPSFPVVAPGGPSAAGAAGTRSGPGRRGWPAPLPGRPRRSAPVAIAVPRAGVAAPLVEGGLLPEDPPGAPPLWRTGPVRWERAGPAPGEPGRAVVSGRLGGRGGPAVFARLPAVRRNDAVAVTRQDGTVVVFGVTSARWSRKPVPARGAGRRGGPPYPAIRLVGHGGHPRRAGNLIVHGDFAGWYRLTDFPLRRPSGPGYGPRVPEPPAPRPQGGGLPSRTGTAAPDLKLSSNPNGIR